MSPHGPGPDDTLGVRAGVVPGPARDPGSRVPRLHETVPEMDPIRADPWPIRGEYWPEQQSSKNGPCGSAASGE